MTLKEIVLRDVNFRGFIHAMELFISIMNRSKEENLDYSSEEIQATINSLVRTGEIIELEYRPPDSGYRARSIYFAKDTVIGIKK